MGSAGPLFDPPKTYRVCVKIGRQVRDSVQVVMPHVQQAVPNPFRDTSIDRSPDSFIVFERSDKKWSKKKSVLTWFAGGRRRPVAVGIFIMALREVCPAH